MRKLRTLLLSTLSAIGIAVSAQGAAEAQTASADEGEIERQCREALEQGTIEALEEFLFRYPNAPGECRVLALNQLTTFSPDPNGPVNGGDPGGYGG